MSKLNKGLLLTAAAVWIFSGSASVAQKAGDPIASAESAAPGAIS